MEIKRNNQILTDVFLLDSSYVYEEIMGEHTITLNFRVMDPVEFEVNDYVEFEGHLYRIRNKERIRKEQSSLGWEYTIKFYSEQYELQNVAFFLQDKPDRKKNYDSFIGTAKQMLELIVKNMNRVYSGWQVGSYLETDAVNFSFKDKKCAAVLDDVAKAFETEYWISGKTISLGKREYDSNGLVLGQGEGMGFRELEITGVNDTPPVTVLYPYGSEKNLTTEYGYDYLLMPGAQLSLEKNVEKYGRFEENKQFDHIYPKGEFTVTEKMDDLTFRASGIDFDLAQYRINEEDIIVTFQTGNLAGYDLAIRTENKGKDLVWDDQKKEITLAVNEDEKDLTVPGDIHFNTGDKFILTGLKMPQKYIEEAEQKLKEAAETYLEENCEKKVQLSGKCDEVFFRKFRPYISCGQMVGVVSEKLDIDREIRVTKIKRFLENNEQPYRYELTLSDFLQSNGFKDIVDDVNKFPDEITHAEERARAYARRNYRDVMELQKQMYDPEGDFFQEAIWPLTVQTMQLVVGAPSLQFKFVNDSGKVYTPDFHFDLHQKVFKAPQGKNLYHMTIGVKSDLTPASTRDWKNYLNWEIPERTFSSLNPVKPYYLYAKCNKNGHTGSYELSETIISLEQESGYYHFWVGFLNSQYEGERSFRTVYGFTEISGGNVTADKLISAGGDSYIHLDENTMHLGDSNSYLDYKDGVTSLKGVVIQSPSGDESPLGAYRGAYRSGTVYYVGDEVTYNGSTYRCMRQGSNIAPPNATYWQVLAAGGTKVEFRYAANTSSTSYPSISTGSRSPSGWSTTPPTLSTTQYLWMTQATINPDDTLATNWSIPVRSSGIKGDKGDTGAPGATGPTGPALNYRGDWVNTEAYELTTLRRDIVRYKSGNSHVYYARAGYTGSTPSGTAITNTNYWQSFGANFESLATGLLFAGKALISGWNFNDNFIWSQHRKCVLNGSDTSNQSTTPILLIGDEALNENLALNPNCAMKVSQNGTITVGEGTSDSNAGITGQGNEPDNVRFWAGATYNNRNSSPFRVTQDGSMVASNAKIQSNTSGNKIIIDPTTRSIRMLASVGNIELEVCKIDFFINGSNSGSTLRLNSYSGSSLRSYTQITGQYVSICDSSGLEFFRADAINEKIWINYHKLPQSRDAAYPREVYMDGETVKVKRT